MLWAVYISPLMNWLETQPQTSVLTLDTTADIFVLFVFEAPQPQPSLAVTK